MQREVWVNGEKLTYTWEKKRVKNLNLRIRPDGSIAVSSAVILCTALSGCKTERTASVSVLLMTSAF